MSRLLSPANTAWRSIVGAREAGFAELLVTPIKIQALETAIAAALGTANTSLKS